MFTFVLNECAEDFLDSNSNFNQAVIDITFESLKYKNFAKSTHLSHFYNNGIFSK